MLVALRSYSPAMTPGRAVELLLGTTRNGHLDVAAAFRAAGLGSVVDAGTAAIPGSAAPAPAPEIAAPAVAARRVPRPSVKRASWRRGVLDITLKSIPKNARLRVKVTFAHRKARHLTTTRVRLRARTPRPKRVTVRLLRDGASSATVTVKVVRSRR